MNKNKMKNSERYKALRTWYLMMISPDENERKIAEDILHQEETQNFSEIKTKNEFDVGVDRFAQILAQMLAQNWFKRRTPNFLEEKTKNKEWKAAMDRMRDRIIEEMWAKAEAESK